MLTLAVLYFLINLSLKPDFQTEVLFSLKIFLGQIFLKQQQFKIFEGSNSEAANHNLKFDYFSTLLYTEQPCFQFV